MRLLNQILLNLFVLFAADKSRGTSQLRYSSRYQASKPCNSHSPSQTIRSRQTRHGTYLGKTFTFQGNNDLTLCPVAQFLGIAYALPPTTSRRWKKPFALNIDEDAKTKEIIATEMGPICPQTVDSQNDDALKPEWYDDAKAYILRQSYINMSEDCLYLNIYAPAELYLNETSGLNDYKTLLPVMVYFHGHTFMEGSGNFYDGSVLASFGKVIVVTFNYRIGVLGFLSFLNGDNRGNYGLWDQLEAVKWIKKNIANFGGDPNRITAFGSGSGAISIHLLMLSLHADNTFRRAILQSGTALSPMALVKLPTYQGRLIAERVNCSGMLTDAIMKCLAEVHWSGLLKASGKQENYKLNLGPVIDREIVQDCPENTMKNNDYLSYQIIVGITQNDGYGCFKQSDGDDFTVSPTDDVEDSFLIAADRFVDAFYNRTKPMDRVDITEIMRKMIDYVYKDTNTKLTPQSAMESVLDMYTDSQWLTPTIKTAHVNSKMDQPTYFYIFGYKPDEKRAKRPWITAAHGDELPFVFGYPFMETKDSLFPYTFTYRDREVSIKVMKYWSNFAKTGNPKDVSDRSETGSATTVRPPTWPRYDESKRIGLYISSSHLTNISSYRHKEYQFWNTLVPRLLELFTSKRKSRDFASVVARDISKVTPVTDAWSLQGDENLSGYPSSESGGGGRKSESGMSLQLTITLAIGFVLLFVNIIAFSIVSYRKRKHIYEIKKLKYELEEKKRLLENEIQSCGIINASSPPDDIILDEGRDYKVNEEPLDGASTPSINYRAAGNSTHPTQRSSNANLPMLKQCVLRDDTPTSRSQLIQGKLQRNNTMQAEYNSSVDGSPINVMTSRSKIDSGLANVIIRQAQTREMKREFTSLDGYYNSHVPDFKFKTHSNRASYAGPVGFPESKPLQGTAVKSQTSLWSLTSAVGSSYPILRNTIRSEYVGSHIRPKDSPIGPTTNSEPTKLSQSWSRRAEFPVRNELATPVVVGHMVDDFTKLSQSHPVQTPSGKSRVSSEISDSETDITMSSPASDRVATYCVTNNKLNVVTKL